MPWLELRIVSSSQKAPALEDALLEAGAHSVTFEDNADEPIFEPALGETPLWQHTRITGLFDADADTASIEAQMELSAHPNFHWHILEDKDWEREWMQHYHPIRCADNLWICPSWIAPPEPEAINLLLDPGLAFGTGTHPTTFLCLQWLAGQSLENKTVIDYGCGSGILAIAASLLGAKQISGVDIDPQALLASADNAQRNGLKKEAFPVYLPGKGDLQTSDLVLANILAGPLVELAPSLLKLLKPGGSLCLSGVLATQAETVMQAYAHEIDFEAVRQKEEWACLVGRKRQGQ